MENPKIILLIPVYNDWESLKALLNEIKELSLTKYKLSLVIIDDSSTDTTDFKDWKDLFITFEKVYYINLKKNNGHQKAISVGLSYINNKLDSDAIIVMDSDGEDKPEYIAKLIESYVDNNNKTVFADRTRRSENIIFRVFYRIYKMFFKIVTGKSISFGNFCLIPKKHLNKIVNSPDIYIHLASALLRSGLPINKITTDRGKRFLGKSKMNFISLIMHGLDSITVFLDIVSIRALIVSMIFSFLSISGILLVFAIKLFTEKAIPGWATSFSVGLTIVFLQSFLVSTLLVFIILNRKTQYVLIPEYTYNDFIDSVKILN